MSGEWKFSSGCRGADLLAWDRRRRGTAGKPLTALLRPEQVEIVENWEVVGFRAPAATICG